MDTDLALLFLKVLRMKHLKSKIILMSATCDKKLFLEYFDLRANDNALIECDDVQFKVKTYYLDTIHSYLRTQIDQYMVRVRVFKYI